MCTNKSCLCQKTSDELLDLFMDVWDHLFTVTEEAQIECEARQG